MNKEKIFSGENSSKHNGSSKKDYVTDNPSDTKRQAVAGSSKSEEQSVDISEEGENVGVNCITYDPQTKREEKSNQKAKVLTEHDEGTLAASTNRKRKIKDETVSSSNPVKIQKPNKCKQNEKDGKEKKMSLRRKVLLAMTVKKYISEMAKSSESTSQTIELQSNFEIFKDKISKMSNKRKNKTRNDNLGSIDTNPISNKSSESESNSPDLQNKESRKDLVGNNGTNPPLLNQFQHKSNKSHEEPRNANQPSLTSKSTSAPSVSTSAQSQNERPGIKVWEHFKNFLHINKEAIDRVVIDDVGRDPMEISFYVNNNLDNARREFTSQSLEEPVKTETENASNVTEENLNCETSETHDDNVEAVLEMVDVIRTALVKKISGYEVLLITKKMDSQQETDLENQVKFLNDARNAQKKLLKLYNILCDHEKIFENIKKHLMNFCSSTYNWSKVTTLIDLPLSARNIRTFSSLLLYQYKSLYYEVPMEKVYKWININEYVSSYTRYRIFKAHQYGEKEKAILDVNTILNRFNACLEQCLLIFKNEILFSENGSYEDDQAFINNLNLAIKNNLNCLNELLSAAFSLVFTVALYLKESRKLTFLVLFYLDKRLDAFSLLAEKC